MTALENRPVPIRIKLSALWAACMFCYVYGDYFGLFQAGRLSEMNAGRIGPLGDASPMVLVGVSLMMAIPSLMVFLSLVLPPVVCRWANIILGLVYTAIMLLTMPGAPPFYLTLGVIEVALTLAVAGCAWFWPKISASQTEEKRS